jgi:hypothetical protein
MYYIPNQFLTHYFISMEESTQYLVTLKKPNAVTFSFTTQLVSLE